MAEENAWYWTIRKKDDPSTIIGMISLYDQENNNRGFWLDPQWHRNGFMTEAVQVVTDFWFNTLNRKVLRAPKSSDNIASRKISIKSGMRLIRLENKDYTLWISSCIATARERIPGSIDNYVTGVSECSQQRGSLKDNEYMLAEECSRRYGK